MDKLTSIALTPGVSPQTATLPEGSVPLRLDSEGGQAFLIVQGPETTATVDVQIYELESGVDPADLDKIWHFGSWTDPRNVVRHIYVEPPAAGGVQTLDRLHDRGNWAISARFGPDALSVNGGVRYRCVRSHVAAASNEPGVGASWEDYWIKFSLVEVASAATFDHVQPVASTTWTINHNLGVRRKVLVLNDAGFEVTATVQHTSLNQVVVTFKQARTGTAHI